MAALALVNHDDRSTVWIVVDFADYVHASATKQRYDAALMRACREEM